MKRLSFLLLNTVFIPGATLAQEVTDLDPIILEGDGNAPQGPYGVVSTDTASRLPVDVQRTPRSVSTVTQEQIKEQGAVTLEDSLTYSAGVNAGIYGLDGRYDEFAIRGFEAQNAGIYRDGMPLRTYSFSGWRTEPFGLEQIDVLRGPTGDLYGANEPGGLVNGQSKRPKFSDEIIVQSRVDDKGSMGFGFDLNRAPSDTWAFRTVFWGGKEETRYDGIDGARLFFAPSVTVEPSDDTKLTVFAQYQKDNVPDNYVLVPELGSRSPNPVASYGPETYTGLKSKSDIETTQKFIGYEFEHNFGAATFLSRARYATNDYRYDTTIIGAVGASAFLGRTPGADPTAVDLALLTNFDVDDASTQLSFDNALRYEFDTGSVSGTLLAGVDHYRVDVDSKITYGNAGALFLTNGFYVGPGTPGNPNPFAAVIPSYLKQDIRQTGAYLIGNADIGDRTTVQASLRHDWVDTESEQLILLTTAPRSFKTSESFTSGSLGLSYEIQDGLNVFASASRSFELPPVGEEAETRNPLKIETANSYEIGLKYQIGDRGSLGLTLFNVDKQNVGYRPDPFSFNYQQIGKLRSRGLEFEGQAELGNGFAIMGSYTYNDAEILESLNASIIGNQFARIPQNSGSIWVTKAVEEGPLDGVTFGFGARHIGKRYSDQSNKIEHEAVTLLDAGISYERENLTVGLTARNLADKEYVAYCTPATGAALLGEAARYSNLCSYGKEREIALTATFEF